MAEKVKLSTTAKKVVNLINQTVSDIYNDAVNRKNETWFGGYDKIDGTKIPGYTNAKPVSAIVFKNKIAEEADNIVKQTSANLTEEDIEAIRKQSASIIANAGNNYERIVDQNGTTYGFTQDYQYDTDPYSQQVGTQRVGNRTYPTYASFMAGRRMGTNVSGYAGTNNTYSMCDIVCTIDIVSNTGEHVVSTLGKLQTLSYSIYQQKQPVRCIGNMNAKDYVYGQRTIAGSLVFAVFNRHWLVDIYDQLIDKGMMKNWHYIADEIPPFNITISFANEYGYDSKMALFGVRLMTEGQVMSINDIYIENTYQFVATDIEYMDALNAWEQTIKYDQRWKQTKAAGTIASYNGSGGNGSGNGTNGNGSGNMGTPTPTPIGKDPEEKNKPDTDFEAAAILAQINQIFIISEDTLKTSTEEEVLKTFQQAYDNNRKASEDSKKAAVEAKETEKAEVYTKYLELLDRSYKENKQMIHAYYEKLKVENKKAS